jgi:hypothetical protein
MYQHENLWIKISDDFHAEINPILEQLNPNTVSHYCFKRVGIQGKFLIINNLLLSLNGLDTNHYNLIRLKNILESYKARIENYFNSHAIATGFIFFAPQNILKTHNYLLKKFSEYSLSYSFSEFIAKKFYNYMIGLNIIGFPNDCSFKLSAKIKNDKIEISRSNDPLFEIEKESGKWIGEVTITRDEQEEIEFKLYKKDPELRDDSEELAIEEFKKFANDIQNKIKSLLKNFDRCINLCNTLIDKQQKDTTPANMSEIGKIYSVLKNGYIQEPFEKFAAIFQPGYSGQKIIWLKDGAELRFLMDKIIVKVINTNKINQWANKRFTLLDPPSNFVSYIGTVKHKNLFYKRLSDDRFEKRNPIYKLSKEF